MSFYVPLGPRGLILRIGGWLTGLLGSLVYWRATLGRGRGSATPVSRERPPSEPGRIAA